jgi:c-di-GMP-binding flagellar brake protein YcgR
MSATLQIPPESGPVPTDVLVRTDRRSDPRVGCHTVVTALAADQLLHGDRLQVIKTHSEDVSVSGARLVSREPLPTHHVYLRFLLPTFGDCYVDAEVVNHNVRERTTLNGQVQRQFIYGVRFLGILTEEEMMNRVMPRPENRPSDRRIDDNQPLAR